MNITVLIQCWLQIIVRKKGLKYTRTIPFPNVSNFKCMRVLCSIELKKTKLIILKSSAEKKDLFRPFS